MEKRDLAQIAPFPQATGHEPSTVTGCRWLKVPSYVDSRGVLMAAESGSDAIPFPIERVFWIKDVPVGSRRGGHSHSTCAEAIFPLQGSCRIHVTDGRNHSDILLDDAQKGILIPPDIWCDLYDFSKDCILVVAASQRYDTDGYVHRYEDYQRIMASRHHT